MNTYYLFEGQVYETKKQAEKAAENFVNRKIDKIETEKDFESFEELFDKSRKDGNSIIDSIEWAK